MAAMLLRTTPFSQRAKPLAVVVEDFPETPHQTRDNTDFPRPLRKGEARLRLACPWREGHRAGQEAGAGQRKSRPQFAHCNDRHPEDRGLYPRCPTRGTSRLQAGRGFRVESIRSDSTINASIHGQEGPPKSDSKRWV